MKDPKKVEADKRLAAINCKKREEQAQLEKTASRVNQYYGNHVMYYLHGASSPGDLRDGLEKAFVSEELMLIPEDTELAPDYVQEW